MLLLLICLSISHQKEFYPYETSRNYISERDLQLTPNTIRKNHYYNIMTEFDVSFTSDPDSFTQITEIPDNLFYQCHINLLTITNHITIIGSRSFYRCTINELYFQPESKMTTISSYAFFSATFVKSINIPDTVEIFGYSAFQNSNIQYINFSKTKMIDKHAFHGCTKLKGSLIFPTTLESIGEYSFYQCKNLSDGLTFNYRNLKIGNSAFQGCIGLSESKITFNNIEEDIENLHQQCSINLNIDDNAFKSIIFSSFDYQGKHQTECKNYISQKVNISITTKKKDLKDVLKGSCGLYLDYVCDSGVLTITGWGSMYDYGLNGAPWRFRQVNYINISLNVTHIGDFAFCGLSIKDILIPNVLTIGYYAFTGTFLTSVYIPRVKYIDERAFSSCENLETLSLPITSRFGSKAFYQCPIRHLNIIGAGRMEDFSNSTKLWKSFSNTLNTIVLDKDITSISSHVFDGFRKLYNITFSDNLTSIGEYAFCNCESLCIIYLDKVTSIGKYTFCNCSSLVSLKLSENLTSINEYLFYNCNSLTSIQIPNSVTSIGDYSFCNCSSLTSIQIPNSVISFGNYSFCNCSSLTSIQIPNSVISIGDYSFSNCSSLTSIQMPNNVTSFGYYSFSYCSSLVSISIPDRITSIGNYIFFYCTSLASINLSNNIKTIGSGAFFGCKSLTSFDIPNELESISSNLFYDCSSLKSISIPNSIKFIGNDVFHGCISLSIINIPDYLISIGSGAFYNCTSIVSINMPDSLESIEDFSFYNCNSLKIINLPKSLTKIGYSSFSLCMALRAIDIPDGVLTIGYYAFYYCSYLTTVKIQNSSLTSIGFYAFSYCKSLKSLLIPDGVTLLNDYCFQNCLSLLSINIPHNIKSIGNYLFINCSSLESIDIPISIEPIKSNLFIGCSSLNTLNISGSGPMNNFLIPPWDILKNQINTINIKDNVSSIGSFAFKNFSKLTSIDISYGITYIGNNSFIGCSSLKSINIPHNVKEIGDNAFYNCLNLRSINISNNMQSIGKYLFYNCVSLKSIDIPNSITSIDDFAFYNCNSLESINIPDNVISIGNNTFNNCSSMISIQMPFNLISIGKNAFYRCSSIYMLNISGSGLMRDFSDEDLPWSSFRAQINTTNIGKNIASIGSYAFSNFIKLSKINLPNSITSIGDYSFSGCKSLKSIDIPKNVALIGYHSFYNCAYLTSINIPIKVKSSGNNNAFDGCSSLYALKLYGSGPMEDFTSLNPLWYPLSQQIITLDIEEGITYIGSYAFYYFDKATSVSIPISVISIGTGAFEGCSSISTLNISGSGPMKDFSVSNSPWNTLRTQIDTLNIRDGITSIGSYAFYYFDKVTSISIPISVTSIGEYSFYNCTSLYSVSYLKIHQPKCSENSFLNCDNLTSITLSPNYKDDSFCGIYFDQNCKVYGCISCKYGFSDKCAKCNSSLEVADDGKCYIPSQTKILTPTATISKTPSPPMTHTKTSISPTPSHTPIEPMISPTPSQDVFEPDYASVDINGNINIDFDQIESSQHVLVKLVYKDNLEYGNIISSIAIKNNQNKSVGIEISKEYRELSFNIHPNCENKEFDIFTLPEMDIKINLDQSTLPSIKNGQGKIEIHSKDDKDVKINQVQPTSLMEIIPDDQIFINLIDFNQNEGEIVVNSKNNVSVKVNNIKVQNGISGSMKNIMIIGDIVFGLYSNLIIKENVDLELSTVNFGCSDSYDEYSKNVAQITGEVVSVPNRITINVRQFERYLAQDNLLLVESTQEFNCEAWGKKIEFNGPYNDYKCESNDGNLRLFAVQNSNKKNKKSKVTITAIIISVIIVIVICICLFIYFIIRKRNRQRNSAISPTSSYISSPLL